MRVARRPDEPLSGAPRRRRDGFDGPLTLSLPEAATVLGIGVSTAYRLWARGEFPVPLLRIGGTIKVSAKRLNAYIEGDGEDAAVD